MLYTRPACIEHMHIDCFSYYVIMSSCYIIMFMPLLVFIMSVVFHNTCATVMH